VLDELDTTTAPPSGRAARRQRRKNIALRWLATAAAFIVLVVVAGLPMYVFPHTDKPARADAVVVLGPATDARIAVGARLVDEGYASHLYISMPPDKMWLDPCHTARDTCFIPKPAKTRGEALFTLDAARTHRWKKVIVVTGDSHVTRARFIFDRCSGVEPLMIGVGEKRTLVSWIYQYSYQTAGFAKALIVGCA
jgi:hypothetical protein